MTAPTEGIDLLLAVKDNAAVEAERLETDAAQMVSKAASMRKRAAALRELHEVTTRHAVTA